MDDELTRESSEETSDQEIANSISKSSIIVKFIVFPIILLAIACVIVFGVIMPGYFGDQIPVAEEVDDSENVVDYQFAVEYNFDMSLTMYDQNGKLKNLFTQVTFETSEEGVKELKKRTGWLKKIIRYNIRNCEFGTFLTNEGEDSLSVKITKEINSYLPEKEMFIIRAYLDIKAQ